MAAYFGPIPKNSIIGRALRCGPMREVTAATNGVRRHTEPPTNHQQKGIPMAQIGTFKRTKTGFPGTFARSRSTRNSFSFQSPSRTWRTRRTIAFISGMMMA